MPSPTDGAGSRMRVDFSIARRLRQERLVAGKSREELARALGVEGRVLDAYETGERPIPARHLAAAVAALGVPLSLFAYDIDPHSRAGDAADPGPWHMVPRPPSVLSAESFSQADAVVKLWQSTRGEMTDDLRAALIAGRLIRRTLLTRQAPHSARLTYEHIDAAINMMLPCETLSMVGRDIDALPDRGYGTWGSHGYAKTANAQRPRIESILADIKMTDAAATVVRARYDRVLIPWHRRGDIYVLCLSLLRHRAVVA